MFWLHYFLHINPSTEMILPLVCLFGIFFQEIAGEGMMYNPPGRSSVWRFHPEFPANYDDVNINCGGFNTLYNKNKGYCGVCGDRYDLPHPQENENTGKYGKGLVVKKYTQGSVIDVNINITANEKGSYNFSLCVLEDATAPESGEKCFVPLEFEDGSTSYQLKNSDSLIHSRLQLPNDTVCDRCVLRWTWRAGNNWGTCPDGTQQLGCGDQDIFRSCADVGILKL